MCRELATAVGGVSLTNSSLAHTAALFARSTLYVGNDSGQSHLAAAQGCPAFSIGLVADHYRPWKGYGLPSRPTRWTVDEVLDRLHAESLVHR